MPAGDDQSDSRKVDLFLARLFPDLQKVGVQMGFDMMDADNRNVQCHRQRLGGGDAHQQRAHQTGTIGNGDSVDI